MEESGKQHCRSYRFSITAISFGEDVDEALMLLLEGLRENPEAYIEEEITYDCLDYVYVVREDLVGEA